MDGTIPETMNIYIYIYIYMIKYIFLEIQAVAGKDCHKFRGLSFRFRV